MERYDVIVVGGGPVGGSVAGRIASEGFEVAVLEEHKRIGEPLKCAGLVTKRVIELQNVDKVIENEIMGAKIYSPCGEVLSIGGDKTHALVINRGEFDRRIMEIASDKGCNILLEKKVKRAKKINDLIQVETNGSRMRCSLLIGADGSRSKIRKMFGFPEPKEFLWGIGAEVKNIEVDKEFVQIFLGRKIAPGFFAWIIPIEEARARIGLCTNNKKGLRLLFSKFLKRFPGVKIINYLGGSIPLGPLKRSVHSNVMLVGDAAAQVKPTSGGGIYPGLLCANICSSVAVESLDNNDFSSLISYHKEWSRGIGRELRFGIRFRNIFKKMEDREMDKYVKKLKDEKYLKVICKHGDIDYPSKLLFPLLKEDPSLLKLLFI